MISLRSVSVAYGPVPVIDHVSVNVAPGEWLGLIGPNGAGKTSLLRAIAGMARMTGTIAIDGQDVTTLSRRRRARVVAYLPQHPLVPADMPVADYVLLGRTPHLGYLAAESMHDRAICAELIDRLELASMAERPLGTLSGGEFQRVTLARALAQEAPVLLLDEPITALDLARQLDALELIDELREERSLAVVAAMHDLTLAGQFADQLLLLERGRAVAVGAPEEVLVASSVQRYYGREVEVLTTADGEMVVVPRRRRSSVTSLVPNNEM